MNKNIIGAWLLICSFCILMMVGIGGITRLTHSGLSITEWKPITGILPPLNQKQWEIEFQKYQLIPEFQIINKNMTIDNFKQIFYVEYFHRLFARITALICITPLLAFYFLKHLDKKYFFRLLSIFMLIGIQGLIGWYMVKSGLKDRINVNEYWLAFHLIFAFIIFSLIYSEALKAFGKKIIFNKINLIGLLLLFIQIILGGLVAGTHIISFCHQNNHNLCSLSLSYDGSMVFFYFHRLFALALFVYSLIILFYNKSIILLCFITIQILLGLTIVFMNYPNMNYFAVLHQINGFLIGVAILNIVSKSRKIHQANLDN